MRRLTRVLVLALVAAAPSACLDDHLNTTPQTILTDDQIWTDPKMVLAVLANFYGRLPDYLNFEAGLGTWGSYDEGLYSGITNTDQVNGIVQYPYSTFATWNYGLVRDINLAIENIEKSESTSISPVMKRQFIAELRFMRAWVYFDMVKRMGGVPIITQQLIYDFSGDPSYLQRPRDTEEAVYDFIASELDAILDDLGNEGSKARANRYTALALKSRAMLYAASIARHNNEMDAPITLPGGEVGIPASRAVEYYQKSLDASRAIIESGAYSLYQANPDPGKNFYEALTVKSNNPEVIWAKDYQANAGSSHLWTLSMIAPSMRIAAMATNQGAALSPSLQVVETYDYIDGRPGKLPGVGDGTVAGQANWIFWDEIDDIFDGKDGRLWGTVIYPGTTARGQQIQLQAGVYVWDPDNGYYEKIEGLRDSRYESGRYADGGILTGADGPRGVENYLSTTGFYVRKYLDEKYEGATSTVGSDIWWVRFRLGEIYLNAAEAAFELGLVDEALGYINKLRERAGFPPNSLTELSRDKIRSERRAELTFEDHRIWDIKRWRIAHLLWDGAENSPTANLWAAWPYRVIHPGHENDGKYVYDVFPSVRQTAPRYFRMGNYYSQIPDNVRGNNPLIVANPFH